MIRAALVLVVVLVAVSAVAAITEPIRVENGLVSGVAGTLPEVRIFKAVPFAAPPVGNLRPARGFAIHIHSDDEDRRRVSNLREQAHQQFAQLFPMAPVKPRRPDAPARYIRRAAESRRTD